MSSSTISGTTDALSGAGAGSISGNGDDGVGLRGTVETFALKDVLRLLAITRKSGCLHVEGDLGRGIIRFRQGALVEASIDRPLLGDWTLAEVISQMLRYKSGSFAFTSEEHPIAVNGQPIGVETALSQAVQLLEEWLELEDVVPSLNHRVTLASELPCDKITVDADTWKLLTVITRRPAVAEFARTLRLGELRAMRVVTRLVAQGIATVEPPAMAHSPRHVSVPVAGGKAAVAALPAGSAIPSEGRRFSA